MNAMSGVKGLQYGGKTKGMNMDDIGINAEELSKMCEAIPKYEVFGCRAPQGPDKWEHQNRQVERVVVVPFS